MEKEQRKSVLIKAGLWTLAFSTVIPYFSTLVLIFLSIFFIDYMKETERIAARKLGWIKISCSIDLFVSSVFMLFSAPPADAIGTVSLFLSVFLCINGIHELESEEGMRG